MTTLFSLFIYFIHCFVLFFMDQKIIRNIDPHFHFSPFIYSKNSQKQLQKKVPKKTKKSNQKYLFI